MGGVIVLATGTPDAELEGRLRSAVGGVAGPTIAGLVADPAGRWVVASIRPDALERPGPPARAASLCAAFHGGIDNRVELRERLPGRPGGTPSQDADDGTLLAGLLDAFGPQVLRAIRGSFHAVVVDQRSARVHLVNDRLGSYPLYWAREGTRLIAAPSVALVLAGLSAPAALDVRAAADYLHFGFIFGNRTLARGVELVPPGAVLSWPLAGGEVERTTYWSLREAFGPWDGDRQEYLRAVREAFNAAVARAADDTDTIGMSLSGGLDSRAVLSALSVAGRPVVTYTLGVTGCADERIAATLSRLANTRHRFVELDERYLGDFLPNLKRMVQLTDGMYLSHGLTEMLALQGLEQLGVAVLLRGHCGELAKTSLAWPFHTDARVKACGTRDEFVSYMADRANNVSRGVPPVDLFAEDGPAHSNAAIASLHDTIDHADLSPAQLCSYLYIEALQRRFTVPSLELFRTRAQIRLPFADTGFLDVLLRGPAEWREGTDVHRFIIGQNHPRLLSVRNSNTGAPGDAGPLVEAVLDRVNVVLKRMNAPGFRHYHRLDRWMRTQLLASVEAVLLDPLTLGRGVFRADTVRRLVAETRAGRTNHSHLLEVLLHIELWQRQHVLAPQTTDPCVALG